jgi:hypothetical protein
VRERLIGDPVGLIGPVLERLAHGRVGQQLGAIVEPAVVSEELHIDDSESFELAEQIGCGVRSSAQRVRRMRLHPARELRVRAGKVEVVHVAITLIQRVALKVYGRAVRLGVSE